MKEEWFSSKKTQTKTSYMNTNIKILAVDDEPDILEFVKYNLKKEGYEIVTANNGKQAIEQAKLHHPHLILLDIMMPELDGIEVCRQLRESEDFNSTIIVFLTARNEDYSEIAGFDVGGDDYITKPIRLRVLISRIKALLRRRNLQEDNLVMTFGDLVIDLEKVMVLVKEEEIALAKKEFELLTLLTSRPGKVFTRDEIFNKIWGLDILVGDRTIDVHIRKIREKLGNHYIKTVKGIGYKFNESA